MKFEELFRQTDPGTPPKDPFGLSAIIFAYVGVIVALAISLTLNIYHDTHADGIGKAHYHPLPIGIAVMVGVGVPLMCGVLSHLAAEVDIGGAGKSIIYSIVAALMYVSATAGTAVMSPIIGGRTAVVLSVATDAAAMFCIHVLMTDQERKTAGKNWAAGAEERKRRAAEERRQAEAAALAARSSNARRAVTPGDNTPVAAAGNTGDNASDNTRAAAPDNTAPRAPGNTSGDHGTGERQGSGGNVTPITARQSPAPAARPGKAPAKTDEELRLLIENFYDHCVANGVQFGTRAFIREHGGSPNRVGRLIDEFLEARRAARGTGEEGVG